MIRVAVSNSLRKRLLGTGNIYFYHSKGGEAQAWQWAQGKATALQGVGKLGVLQQWQNQLAQLLENYLGYMASTARKIFETERFFSIYYKKSHGGEEYEYEALNKETGQKYMRSSSPISKHFFSGVTKRGKVIRGSFGNNSEHAIYVEWGTGPVGKANANKIPRSMKERRGMPKYKATGWSYYNPAVDHVIGTRGMPPRPFVYPAFLRLRSAFVNDCKAVLRNLNQLYFRHNESAQEGLFDYGED